MFTDNSASEHEPESEHERTMRVLEPGFSPVSDEPYLRTPSGHSLTDDSRPGSHHERERFASRSARLMSRYEGLQPCLPREAFQRPADACSEPFSSPRDGDPDRTSEPGYEPAQGEYGYQRYPQGYEPPQMWYGHDRASLPSDAGSEGATGTYATSDYAQSQGESEYPTSASETSDMASSVPQDGEGHDGPSPDTTRTLASIFEAGIGRAASDRDGSGGGAGPDDQDGSSPEGYEPAQGEYGYQRYPQGYEPPQMWYGHDRASLPGQAPVGMPAPGTGVPVSSDQPTFGETDDYESVSPDTKKSLAKIFQDGTPYPVQTEDSGTGTGGGTDLGETDDYESISPDTKQTLARIVQDGTPYPLQAEESGTGFGGPPGASKEGSEPYEPAQGEYGYQRYPQGYEPPQMWYGHDRASLPGRAPAGTPGSGGAMTASTEQPASDEVEDYESVSPDTMKSLAKIFQDGTPYPVQIEDSGTGTGGGTDLGETDDYESISPDTKQTLAKIFKDGTPYPVQAAESDTGSSGSPGATRDGGEPYEPAQGEYGYQRYPQGYELPQMWYGHDRASLPGQRTAEPTSATEQSSAAGMVGEENYDGIQPDTTRTLAKIFQDGTPHGGKSTFASDRDRTDPAAGCQDGLSSWSETSIGSAETPPASRSVEYIPAAGMYGYQPPLGPPSRGSLEHLPPSDGTYTQNLCAWQCPDNWPPTPSTPRSTEDVSAPQLMAEYTEGLRWDGPGKDWPQTPETPSSREDLAAPQYTQGLRWDRTQDMSAPTPPTPGSQERLQQTADRPASDENFDFISPDTTRTMAALFEQGIPHMAQRKTPVGTEGEGYEPAQGEYGYQRYPQGYEPPQMWYGHDRASISSLRSSQDLGSQAVSSTDPSPAITPRPATGYEPAQGIYGFQRVFADDRSIAPAPAAAATDSAETFDGPCPDTSRSLERIFQAGTAPPGEQRPLTPSPNLPAFLEKLASSSESEDSASRRRGRPSDPGPAVRVPRNRFYSMEEMCTTSPSPSNLTLSSPGSHSPRVTPRPGDQQCYLPWTHRVSGNSSGIARLYIIVVGF